MLKSIEKNREDCLDFIISHKPIKYEYAISFMEKRVNDIKSNKKSNLVWLLFHQNIFTKGNSSKDEDFLIKPKIPIYKTNRGGQITYHGPGQRIVYYIINLNKKKDIRFFISSLEKIVISTLKELNIESKSYKDRVGIWVVKVNNVNLKKEKKIGFIGVRIKKWIAYHGFSLNINPDMNFFNQINPCGLKNYQMTSLKQLGVKVDQNNLDKLLIEKSKKYLKDFF